MTKRTWGFFSRFSASSRGSLSWCAPWTVGLHTADDRRTVTAPGKEAHHDALGSLARRLNAAGHSRRRRLPLSHLATAHLARRGPVPPDRWLVSRRASVA